MEIFSQFLKISYASAGIVALIAYWPTIKDLYQKKPSANIISYVMWTIVAGIGFLYSLFILPDFLFRLVSGVNFSACALVLLLILRLKIKSS